MQEVLLLVAMGESLGVVRVWACSEMDGIRMDLLMVMKVLVVGRLLWILTKSEEDIYPENLVSMKIK